MVRDVFLNVQVVIRITQPSLGVTLEPGQQPRLHLARSTLDGRVIGKFTEKKQLRLGTVESQEKTRPPVNLNHSLNTLFVITYATVTATPNADGT